MDYPNHRSPFTEVHKAAKSALSSLTQNEFIEFNNKQQKLIATKLGKAATAASLPPEEALVVFHELRKARKNFVLDTELHLVYQVTPIFHNIEPNWDVYPFNLSIRYFP